MKKLWIPLLVIVCAACRQKRPQLPPGKDPFYEKAGAFLERQRNDSAFYYFNRAAGSSRDSLQVARAYNQMAAIQSDAGDDFGSQESLSLSLKFLNDDDEKDRKCLASDYNELGVTSFNLKNYDGAIGFYDRALQFSDNPKFRAVILNNEANAYQKKKAYSRALQIYRANITQVAAGGKEYARILSNMAKTKWLQDPGYRAAPDLLHALHIRTRLNDLTGQNASYMHLSDYYAQSHPDSALFFAGEMYKVAGRIPSTDDQLDALQKLIRLSPAAASKNYFTIYQRLNDSVQTAHNAAKNQFALIRYDAEKNKLDNLRLQKDNTEKKYELIKKNILLYSTIGLLILMTGGAVVWYRKRKQRQEEETREAVRETQRKASKKVHDTLANDIYRVMKKVQYEAGLDREELLDDIDDVYRRARDISYELVPGADEDFQEKISTLLLSFGSETTKVVLVGNSRELWQKIEPVHKFEIKYILQELMVNMQKHSRATNVVVKFEEEEGRCVITYADDGIGMPEGTIYKNGLTNTGNRIKAIQGELNFDSSSKGLTIQLCFKARLS